MAKAFFITSLIKCLQEDVPEFAGKVATDLEGVAQCVFALDRGDTCVVHRLALTVLAYALDEATPRYSFRIVSLDNATPLVLEFDTPFGTTSREDDWDAGTVAFQILAPSKEQAFAHPVVLSILDFHGLTVEEAEQALDVSLDEDNPGALLQAHMDDEGERRASAVGEAKRHEQARFEQKLEASKAQDKRDRRRLEQFNESLQQQLETSQAIASRHKLRAEDLGKQLKASAGQSGQPAAQVAPKVVEVRDTEEVEALRLQLAQQRAEMDGLRSELHRANLRLEALPAKDIAPASTAIPATFDGMQGWIERNLDSARVLVHPKAMRAARKSVFRDSGLAYRTLQAINDFYWPMKIGGDVDAGRKWEEFLRRERLTFGSTGAALDDHRTRDSYRLTYQKRQYPLDLHVQGSSSRKEEDCFRLYFHASKEVGKVLVGHFPTHLPNTHD